MSRKLTGKFFSFSLVYIFLYFFIVKSVYGVGFQKLFNIQSQTKIKDLSFEFEVSEIRKNLEAYYPLKSLKDFKIKVYWLRDGSFDIAFSGLPKGKKGIEKRLKLQTLENLKILFPSDKLKALKKVYDIKKTKNILFAVNNSLNRRKVIIELNENGLIKKIQSFFPLNKIIEEYKYKKNNEKYLMVSRRESNSAYKDNYFKNTSYSYNKISESTLPTKIEITEVIKTKLRSNSKKVKENSFKRFYFFKNYKINKGIAKSHFDSLNKDKK